MRRPATAGTATWTVKDVTAKVGDAVKRGDVLATGASADLSRQVQEATASWRSARIQLTIAQENLDAATTTDATRQAQMSLYNAQNQVSQAAQIAQSTCSPRWLARRSRRRSTGS